jgi:multicomponent Na+:H+ antiporter subunit E
MRAPTRPTSRPSLRAAALRALGFAVLWWVLTEGRGGGWFLAVGSVAAATAASLALLPERRGRSPAGLLRFAAFFLAQAVLGGVDVARRALHPRLPIRPGFSEYRLRVRGETARALLLNTVSLVPGTLSARLRGDRLLVHALDSSVAVEGKIAEIEERLAAALGLVLDDARGG